ncbi:DNA repair protein RecO [Corynebacterium auriscanis]|uniref:DNA repair protein RecO n=1 Tax=Corynebacterium auriscanis TaxID=99807 RepID=UPI0024ADEC84|nr:DNA repair protein RecO [Corynebacterium auriscanis]
MPRRTSSPRPTYRDEAFVLRTHKLGEADLILVLLTRDHGQVRGVAKAIRKSKSRFGAKLDRFTRVNVQIYPSRGLANITDADAVESYAGPIVADPDRYFAGCAALEVAHLFGGEDSSVFLLLDATLRDLAAPHPSLPLVNVVDRFVLKALDMAGWAPSLVDCAQCGKTGPHRAFHPMAGGAVCVTCRPPGAMTPPGQAVRLLWLLANDRNNIAAEVATDRAVSQQAHELLLSHVRYHLESGCPAYAAL